MQILSILCIWINEDSINKRKFLVLIAVITLFIFTVIIGKPFCEYRRGILDGEEKYRWKLQLWWFYYGNYIYPRNRLRMRF